MTSNVSYAALAKSLSDGKSPKEAPVETQTPTTKTTESKDIKDTKDTNDIKETKESRGPVKDTKGATKESNQEIGVTITSCFI